MKSLSEYTKENSKWVKVEEGKSYVGIFKGYTFFNKDNNGEIVEVVRYSIEDIKDGKIRSLDSASASLATQMDKIKIGETIKLFKNGKGFDTKWNVEGMGITNQTRKMYEDGEVEEKEIPIIEDDIPEISEEELQSRGL
jgi:hypothetical protein